MSTRPRRPDLAVAPGERLLAWAAATDGRVVGGTRDAFYLTDPVGGASTRIAWEQVEAADWDGETGTLRVSEVGTWGAQRPEHQVTLENSRRLLQLVRERVSASVVFQQHVPISGRRGLRVVARRAPGGAPGISWFYEYDADIDPEDPEVRRLAADALAVAREQLGE